MEGPLHLPVARLFFKRPERKEKKEKEKAEETNQINTDLMRNILGEASEHPHL